MPVENDPISRDIHTLLQQVQKDEDLRDAAKDYMLDYRAFALACPRKDHVDLLRVLLRTRLTALVKAARRDGLL